MEIVEIESLERGQKYFYFLKRCRITGIDQLASVDPPLHLLSNYDWFDLSMHRSINHFLHGFNAFHVSQEYLESYSVKLKKSEEKFERLKDHAEETLEKANREIENLTRSQVSSVWTIPDSVLTKHERNFCNNHFSRKKSLAKFCRSCFFCWKALFPPRACHILTKLGLFDHIFGKSRAWF